MNRTTATTTFDMNVPVPEVSKGTREARAFCRLLPEFLVTHAGKYVAIHDGQVIDTDTDDIALILRVHARIGYVPIHVGLVIKDQILIRVPHYHEARPGEGELDIAGLKKAAEKS